MAFPSNPVEGQSYTENNTVWIYSAVTGQWNRSVISQVNETTYIGADGAPSGIGGDTQVIFNSNGSFAGDSGLTYNKTTDALTSGSLKVTSLGTAAAPAISVTGDPNTGIYSPGADQLALSTNGTGRLFIDANGDITSNTSPSTGLGVRLYGTATGTNVDATTSRGVSLFLHQTSNTNNNASAILFANALTNTGAYIAGQYTSHTNRQTALVFGTGDNAAPMERLRITSAGNVGIGTTSPGATLHVEGSELRVKNGTGVPNVTLAGRDSDGTAILAFQNNGSSANNAALTATTNTLAIATGGTERARIDSSGRLLVGTSSARNLGLTCQTQIEGTTNATSALSITNNQASAEPAYLIFGKSRAGSIGGVTSVSADDYIGLLQFAGADGTDANNIAAEIACRVDGTPGSNDMPGRLVFSTTADGASSPTERLRITSAGVLQVADAGNITVGTTTGTKIGTATTQKLGFFNATPVVQPTAVADATDAASVITQLNDLLAKLRTLGIIAT